MSDATQVTANFEKASREKYRYQVPGLGGSATTEDLWTLSKNQLNDTAVALDNTVEAGGKKSFLAKKSTALSDKAAAQLAVVLHVLRTKEAEEDAAKKAIAKRARRAELLEQLELRNKEADQKKTPEEILKELEELDKE
jgi:hypothetical protein